MNKEQCQAVTKSDKIQCSRNALPKSNYCWQHQPKKVKLTIFSILGVIITTLGFVIGFWSDLTGKSMFETFGLAQNPEASENIEIGGDVENSTIIQSGGGDVEINTDVNELMKEVEAGDILNRIYDVNIDYLIMGIHFTTIQPEELSLLILAQEFPEIRIDFYNSEVKLVSGIDVFTNPLGPISQEIYQDYNSYIYIVDFTDLRRVAPEIDLANLTLRNLDNSTIKILLDDDARQRMTHENSEITHFTISATAEVSGYQVPIIDETLTNEGFDPNAILQRELSAKPNFVMLILPTWKIRIGKPDKSDLVLGDSAQAVGYFEREAHISSWEGIWPDDETLMYFHQEYNVPLDDNLIMFHPNNQYFVGLKDDFGESGNTTVSGISALYRPGIDRFTLFAAVIDNEHKDAVFTHSVGNQTVNLSRSEIVTIINILTELAKWNHYWVEVEGNYIDGLIVVLPEHNEYLALDSRRYYEYNLANPYNPETDDAETAVKAILSHSILEISDLP